MEGLFLWKGHRREGQSWSPTAAAAAATPTIPLKTATSSTVSHYDGTEDPSHVLAEHLQFGDSTGRLGPQPPPRPPSQDPELNPSSLRPHCPIAYA